MPRRSVVVALLAGLAVAVSSATAQKKPSIVELLDRYATHDFEAPVSVAAVPNDDARKIVDELEQRGSSWTTSRGNTQAAGRRLVAATLALDLARVWSVNQYDSVRWRASRQLIAWGCEQLRKNPAPADGERWWHLAAIALFESRQDTQALVGNEVVPPTYSLARLPAIEGGEGHLSHAMTKFPSEPRFRFARVFASEMATWSVGFTIHREGGVVFSNGSSRSRPAAPVEARARIGALPPEITPDYVAERTEAARPLQGPRDRRNKSDIDLATQELARIAALRELPKQFEALFGLEEIAAEARLHFAYSSLRFGDRSRALEALVQAEAMSTDPVLLYMIRVYAGSAHEALQHPADAIAAYGRALNAAPAARTAGLLLSSALMRESRVADAQEISGLLLSRPDAIDPIVRYRTGDHRFLLDYLDRLKKVLP